RDLDAPQLRNLVDQHDAIISNAERAGDKLHGINFENAVDGGHIPVARKWIEAHDTYAKAVDDLARARELLPSELAMAHANAAPRVNTPIPEAPGPVRTGHGVGEASIALDAQMESLARRQEYHKIYGRSYQPIVSPEIRGGEVGVVV